MQVTDAMVKKAVEASGHQPTEYNTIWMRAALTAAMAELWRPIEEAPKDGTRRLVYVPRYGAMSGHFDGRWHCHGCLNRDAEPTHFMPLPAPPKTGGE